MVGYIFIVYGLVFFLSLEGLVRYVIILVVVYSEGCFGLEGKGL